MARVPLRVCLLLATLAWPAGSAAGTIDEARAAYAEGRFAEAAEIGQALGSSEGYALAADALAVYGYYVAEGDDERRAAFERGVDYGTRAIELDAGNPQAHLQWAHALGRYSETVDSMQAFREGMATKMRDGVEESLALDPKLADAHLMLGGWHAQAVRNGGAMARVMFGASNKRAMAHYDQALRLAPESKNVLYHYAAGLLIIDPEENRSEARAYLTRAVEAPSADAYERILHERALEQLASLQP